MHLFKAVIADDEPAARRLLRSMLVLHDDVISVVGEAANGRESLELIGQLQPDVVFLDIQMPDLTGFEVLEKLPSPPDIIFVTAYEEYALKAFQTFSIDYLLKPVAEERLTKTIDKLKRFGKQERGDSLQALKKLLENLSPKKMPTAFPIKQGEKIMLLRFETISYFEADDKYVAVFTLDGKKYLTDQTLTALAETLPPSFLRVQKSYIVNREQIREVHKHFNGRYVLVMSDLKGSRITTGLTFYESVKSALGL